MSRVWGWGEKCAEVVVDGYIFQELVSTGVLYASNVIIYRETILGSILSSTTWDDGNILQYRAH